MKGDFSRSTFDASKHYTSVRMQQGRVQVDADWNEQADIAAHQQRTLVQNLVGAAGVPAAGDGFAISAAEDSPQGGMRDLLIGAGSCYVDGILCENERAVRFTQQPNWPAAVLPAPGAGSYIAYLDVWSRDVSAAEDPGIREVALGGPDTATRSQTIWQVKLLAVADQGDATDASGGWRQQWQQFAAQHDPSARSRMQARCRTAGTLLENQLYRVEIHGTTENTVSFMWSRENGAVTFPISKIELVDGRAVLTVSGVDLDAGRLQRGDWVELASDEAVLNQALPLLVPVFEVDRARGRVILEDDTPVRDEATHTRLLAAHPLLRRWDQKPGPGSAGVVTVKRKAWADLEHGIQVYFEPEGRLLAGDYWLIPARSTGSGMGGSIEWPAEAGGHGARAPHGGYHQVIPLALLSQAAGSWQVTSDLRQRFGTLPALTATTQTTREDLDALGESYMRTKMATEEALQRLDSTAEQLQQDLLVFGAALAVERGRLYEDVTSPDDLEVGDVVAAGNEQPWHVERAHTDNQSRVFGVVTATADLPGHQDRARVTIYGRARCKVVGPVRAGDLLVPSSVPGCARRRRGFWPRLGNILGKALADYQPPEAGAVGMVDVLVMLG